MMQLNVSSQAGSLESNDVLVLIEPKDNGFGIEIEIKSIVINQFGDRIREIIKEKLKKMLVDDVYVKVQDNGALDCTIEARVEAAVKRAR